jgi:hypothetical protein
MLVRPIIVLEFPMRTALRPDMGGNIMMMKDAVAPTRTYKYDRKLHSDNIPTDGDQYPSFPSDRPANARSCKL